MEVFFSLNFFNFLYLKNALLLLFFLSSLTYLFFYKKVSLRNIEEIFFYNLYTISFLIIASVFFNVFSPFNKKASLIFTVIILSGAMLSFFLQNGWQKIGDDLNYLLKKRFDFLKKLLILLLVYIFLVIFVNLSLFKTNTPYSWGFNVDLYTHTQFINQLQNEKYFDWCLKDNHFSCSLKDVILMYPRGSHSLIAYLDLILPASFINKTDYGFIIFSIFVLGIISYVILNRISLIFIIPFLLLPSFTIMLYRDHVNSAVFQIPLFLIYKLLLEKQKNEITNKLFYFKGGDIILFIFLTISGYLTYYFSLILALLPVFIFINIKLIYTLLRLKKHRLILGYLFLIFIVFSYLLIGKTQIINVIKGVILSAYNQHKVDTVGFNLFIDFRDFIGYKIFSYNYFDRFKENKLLQNITSFFWLIILFLYFKKLTQRKKFFFDFFLLFNFLFFLIIEVLTGGWSYLQIRYYSYLSVLLLVYFLLRIDFLTEKKFFRLLILIISFLTSVWYYRLYIDNQVYVRQRLVNSNSVDYMLPSFTFKEAGTEKNVLIMHNQDFNRIFVLFFPYQIKNIYSYDRWDGRLIEDEIVFKNKLNFENKNISQINLKKINYLVVPYNFSYPKKIFSVIIKSEANNYKLLKKNHDVDNLELNLKIPDFYMIGDLEKKLNENFFYSARLIDDKNSCFEIYMNGKAFKDFLASIEKSIRKVKIEYLINLKENNWLIEDKESLIYQCDI
mgnify:CR=1 FL=1